MHLKDNRTVDGRYPRGSNNASLMLPNAYKNNRIDDGRDPRGSTKASMMLQNACKKQ